MKKGRCKKLFLSFLGKEDKQSKRWYSVRGGKLLWEDEQEGNEGKLKEGEEKKNCSKLFWA